MFEVFNTEFSTLYLLQHLLPAHTHHPSAVTALFFSVAPRKVPKRPQLFGCPGVRTIDSSSRQSASLPTIAESATGSSSLFGSKRSLIACLGRSLRLTARRKDGMAPQTSLPEQPTQSPTAEEPELCERLQGAASEARVDGRRGSVDRSQQRGVAVVSNQAVGTWQAAGTLPEAGSQIVVLSLE